MAKRLVFSDLHFGDPLCSLRRKSVAEGLRGFLRGLGNVDELILAGDILDANISSLTQAIEGRKGSGSWPRQIGFRKWLGFLFEGGRFNVGRIVYVPGNHDYIIWNILSTDRAFVEPISKGRVPVDLPLMEGTFPEAFIRGVAPKALRDNFVVIYPDYEFELAGRKVFVTHGHYLDEKQTLFKNLQELIRKEGGDEAKAVRKFFIGTAQYQAVANSVSYMKGTREFVDKVNKTLSDFFDIIGKLRNQPIDKELLEAIEMYLRYFRKKRPHVFMFGHTHEAGHTYTNAFNRGKGERLIRTVIEVWNDGSFIENRRAKRAGTFIATDDDPETGDPIKLYEVDLKGNVVEKII